MEKGLGKGTFTVEKVRSNFTLDSSEKAPSGTLCSLDSQAQTSKSAIIGIPAGTVRTAVTLSFFVYRAVMSNGTPPTALYDRSIRYIRCFLNEEI